MTSKPPTYEEFLTGYSTGKSATDAVNLRVAAHFTGPRRMAAGRALGAPAA